MEDKQIVYSCSAGYFVECQETEYTHIMSIQVGNPTKIGMLATCHNPGACLVYYWDAPYLVGHSFSTIAQSTGWKYCKEYKPEPITIEDIENQITF